MIFLTTFATGLFAGMLRSAFAVIAVAFMICVVFAFAAITGPVSLVSFGLSILGFNLGLAALLGGYMVLGKASPTT